MLIFLTFWGLCFVWTFEKGLIVFDSARRCTAVRESSPSPRRPPASTSSVSTATPPSGLLDLNSGIRSTGTVWISDLANIFTWFFTVLLIHEILVRVRVRIRIRIRGSIPLTNESGSCNFRQWSSRYLLKIIFFSLSLVALLIEGQFSHLLYFSKIKSQKKVTKQ